MGRQVSPDRAVSTPNRVLLRQSDAELVVRFQATREPRAVDELMRRYLPLARRLALRYARLGEPMADLVQVACAAFVAAVERFDPERGSLRPFAVTTMLGELRRHLRDKTWSVRVPRTLQENSARVSAALDRLSQALGRSPTLREIADAVGLTPEQVADASEARESRRARSLDADADEDQDWHAVLGKEDEGYERADRRVELRRALHALPERERLVVELRFGSEFTQSEIGQQLGISQMHVSRLLCRALARLAVVLGTDRDQPEFATSLAS